MSNGTDLTFEEFLRLPINDSDLIRVVRMFGGKKNELVVRWSEIKKLIEASNILLKVNGVNNLNQSILNLIQGTNVTLTDNGDGSVTINSTGGGGGTYTVDNGLTENPAGNFQLGGDLIQNTTVNGLANFLMTFTSSRGTPFPTLFIQNTGTGYGLWITSNNVGQRITTLPASGNTIQTILELIRGTSGTPAIGMGQEILFSAQSTSGSIITANRIISRLTGVTPAAFTSEMLFTATLNNVEKDVLLLLATGQLRLHNYGSGTFTGTATYYAAWDANGNFIEEPIPSGGTPLEIEQDGVSIDANVTKINVSGRKQNKQQQEKWH